MEKIWVADEVGAFPDYCVFENPLTEGRLRRARTKEV
jgi:hypothetical protein